MTSTNFTLLNLLTALSGRPTDDCDCGSPTCHVKSRAAINKCPATKTEEREFTYDFELDELCREFQVDPVTVDKRLFQPHLTANGKVTRDHNSLMIQISVPLIAKKCVFAMHKIARRVDTLESNLATVPPCKKYSLMEAEDAMAMAFFKQGFGALLKSPKANLDNLSSVSAIRLVNEYEFGATCAAKKSNEHTLRIGRSTVEEVVPALLEEAERAAILIKAYLARTNEDSEKWTKFANDYVNADTKKKQDKKEKEEAETKERMAKDAANRAAEAAALKVQLGNPTLAEQTKADSI